MSHSSYHLTETSPPGAEPLTLEEVKTFLRIEHDHDDGLIAGLISAARQFCEQATGRSMITRGYSLYLDRWPSARGTEGSLSRSGWWDGVREGAAAVFDSPALSLPKPPLFSVTRINTYNAGNVATEMAAGDYFVDTAGTPGRIVLTGSAMPPVPGRIANGIEIQFKAGYGATPQSVPMLLRQGMRQLVAHLYEHRGDDASRAMIVSGAAAIFQSYRIAGLS